MKYRQDNSGFETILDEGIDTSSKNTQGYDQK
jgi:hypothetical protein